MTKLDASMNATVRADRDQRARSFGDALIMVIDGSGTALYAPLATVAHMMSYCFWKAEFQTRWYVVVDMLGRILFVSSTYAGKIDDTTALDSTAFFTWLRAAVPSPVVNVGGRERRFFVGGDKGYYAVKAASLQGIGIILTDSAVDAAAGDGVVHARSKEGRQRAFSAAHPHSLLSPRFATHRCVVERVIGAIKRLSRFVAGPIYLRQSALMLPSVLLVVTALINRRLDSKPNLFVRQQQQQQQQQQ